MTRVVLTQPAPRIERIAAALRRIGHDVVQLPARRLVPVDGAAGWADGAQPLESRQVVIFVSPAAAEFALDALRRPWPAGVAIGAVGPGSVEAIRAHPAIGAAVRIVAPAQMPYDAESLMRDAAFAHPMGLNVLVVRGERGRSGWIERLREQGARVDTLALYRSEPVAPAADCVERVRAWAGEGARAAFVFTSVDAIDAFERQPRDTLAWAHRQPAITVHPRLEAALRERGWTDPRVVEPGERGLVAGIESCS